MTFIDDLKTDLAILGLVIMGVALSAKGCDTGLSLAIITAIAALGGVNAGSRIQSHVDKPRPPATPALDQYAGTG